MDIAPVDEYPREVKGWADLTKCVEHFSGWNGHEWLFRGVPDESFDLVPKVGRHRVKALAKPKRLPYKVDHERALLQLFKQQAPAYLPHASRNALEWMALAQHFGVPTRLLDWSDSFIVALWFAVQDLPDGRSSDAAVWVTRNQPWVADPDSFDPFTGIPTPLIYRPPHVAPRIGAQGSVLMVCPSPSQPLAEGTATKIIVRAKGRFQLRKRLDALGVNARSVYGDLSGLGEYLAWRYRNGYLAGGLDRNEFE